MSFTVRADSTLLVYTPDNFQHALSLVASLVILQIGAPLTFTEFYAGRVWTQRIRPAVTNVPIHVYASEAFAINIKRIPRFIRGIVNSRALPKLSSDEKNRRILVQRANLLAKKKATKNSMVTEEWGEHK